ncbi:MAG: hypothetical protein Q9184_004051 [Pyrenodesmia sp. 2 TL-2023]
MGSFLPEELLASLNESIRCRQLQIQQLACLIASDFPSPPNLVLHGTQATGKSLTVDALLQAIEQPSAIIRSKECITTRHLLERTLSRVQDALEDALRPVDGRCESISAFVVQLQRLLDGQKKFILVFDNIDRQREAAPTLLPALARLNETASHTSTSHPTPAPSSSPSSPHPLSPSSLPPAKHSRLPLPTQPPPSRKQTSISSGHASQPPCKTPSPNPPQTPSPPSAPSAPASGSPSSPPSSRTNTRRGSSPNSWCATATSSNPRTR